MQRTILTPVTLLALGAMTLGGCSAFENFGGQKKVSPDEFKIVSHSPLTMPPNADLRPPRPGEPRPQEITPADQAKEALSPTMAGRVQQQQAAKEGAAGDASERSLVAKASKGGVDPNIRSEVNRETRTLADQDKGFMDSLIFWQKSPPPGTIIDPTKEQQRLRGAEVSGQPSTEPTPTIKRRQRGWLEGIF
ncbi:MAG: DUF3035 domain-containing protein [Proteobacteria bacterium]|nr:DUF3035 domain-containing protein [Pseudomonadota bacterium]